MHSRHLLYFTLQRQVSWMGSKIRFRQKFKYPRFITKYRSIVFRNFYRAQILTSDMHKGTSTIRYIDYGNIASVPSNSLCVIQSQFINVPPYALQCRIHNSKIIHEIHKKTVYDDIKAWIHNSNYKFLSNRVTVWLI